MTTRMRFGVCPGYVLSKAQRRSHATYCHLQAVAARSAGSYDVANHWAEIAHQTERGFAVWWRLDGGSLETVLVKSSDDR